MKAAGYPRLLAGMLGFSAAPASAQGAPGDPAGNETIPMQFPEGENGTTTGRQTCRKNLWIPLSAAPLRRA
jgi:hypothetical protein